MNKVNSTEAPRRTKRFFGAVAGICAVTFGMAGVGMADPAHVNGYLSLESMPVARVSDALAADAIAPNSYGFHGALRIAHDKVLVEGVERDYTFDHQANFPSSACTAGANCNTIVGGDPSYRTGTCPGGGDPGCVTVIGHTAYENGAPHNGQVYIPALTAQDHDDELHLALNTNIKSLYAGVGEFTRSSSYAGYPRIKGAGVGLTLAPDFHKQISPYGSVWFYPHVSGNYTGATSATLGPLSGAHFTLAYRVTTYEAGAIYSPAKSRLFAGLSFSGDSSRERADAPTSVVHNALALTFGLHR